MSSIRTQFTDIISNFLRENILPTIVDHFINVRKVECTVDELVGLLDLPPRTTPSMISSIQIPQSFAGQNRLPATSIPNFSTVQAVSAGRAKKVKEVDPNAPRCQYKFTRAPNKGRICEKSAVDGQRFCRDCLKKKAVQNEIAAEAAGHMQGPNIPQAGGMMQGFVDNQVKKPEIKVKPFKKFGEGFLIETTYGFVVKKVRENHVVVYCVADEAGNDRPLTMREKQIAQSMRFVVTDETRLDTSSTDDDDSLSAPIGSVLNQNGMMPPVGYNQNTMMMMPQMNQNGMMPPVGYNQNTMMMPQNGTPNQNMIPSTGQTGQTGQSSFGTLNHGTLNHGTLNQGMMSNPSVQQSVGFGAPSIPQVNFPQLSMPSLNMNLGNLQPVPSLPQIHTMQTGSPLQDSTNGNGSPLINTEALNQL
ncbi:hypothetical protein D3C87_806300 [compost metagenome]